MQEMPETRVRSLKQTSVTGPTDPVTGEDLLPGLQMAACILKDGEQRGSELSCTFS